MAKRKSTSKSKKRKKVKANSGASRSKRRTKLSKEVEARILLMSRRRCCLCFVYEKTDVECRGQIAHIDRNRNNNKFDNLAFLCMRHHDAYDSKTSQSKAWQAEEVKRARQILYDSFDSTKKLIITLDGDFDTLSEEFKTEINSIIQNAVGRDVEIKITPGSIKIEVSASTEKAKELLIAAREGMLNRLGEYTMSVVPAEPDGPVPLLLPTYKENLLTAAVPRELTLDTVANPDSWQEWEEYEFFKKRVPDRDYTVLVAAGGNALSLQKHKVMISLFLFHDEISISENDEPINLLDKFANRYASRSYFMVPSQSQLIHKNIQTHITGPVHPRIAWDEIQRSIEPSIQSKSLKIAVFFYDSAQNPVLIQWMSVIDLEKYGFSLKEHHIEFPTRLMYSAKL